MPNGDAGHAVCCEAKGCGVVIFFPTATSYAQAQEFARGKGWMTNPDLCPKHVEKGEAE